MGIEVSTLVEALLAVLGSGVGWLVLRAIKGVDAAIASLAKEVKALSAQDSKTAVEITEIRARLVRLETDVLGLLARERERAPKGRK